MTMLSDGGCAVVVATLLGFLWFANRLYQNQIRWNERRILIGFVGHAGHGKDTCGDWCANEYGFRKDAFAGPLKDAARILFMFTHEQLYGKLKEKLDSRWGVSPREVLQFFGTEIVRDKFQELLPTIGEQFWLQHFRHRLEAAITLCRENPFIQTSNVVVCDVRFENEAQLIRNLGGLIVKVVRPDHDAFAEHKTDAVVRASHASESSIDRIRDPDLLLVNDGSLTDLYRKLQTDLLPLLNAPRKAKAKVKRTPKAD